MVVKSLRANIIANLLSKLWAGALSLISVPIFVRLLGVEAYGLIGLFATIQVVFTFLDLGMTATINREIARNIAKNKPASDNLQLLKTFELIYWSIGLVIGLIILLSSRWIANNWVNLQELKPFEVQLAIQIMALSFVVFWPISLYTGVLRGLEEQALQNIVTIISVTLRIFGPLAIMVVFTPSVAIFLIMQAIAYLFEVSVNMSLAWGKLGKGSWWNTRFDINILKEVWQFAFGFNLVGLFGTLLAQADKIIISKTLPLAEVGFYTIAGTAAGFLNMISNAVVIAMYPRFSAKAVIGDIVELSKYYHNAIQMISFPVVGAACLLVFFPFNILYTWTQSYDIASQTATTLAFLAIAGLLNSILNPAYTLIIAYGYIKIPLLLNVINIFIFIPIMLIFIPMGGIQAAALIWGLQNMVFFVVYIIFAQKILLRENIISNMSRDVISYMIMGCLWIGGFSVISKIHNIHWILYLSAGLGGYVICTLYLSCYLGIFPNDIFVKFINGHESMRTIAGYLGLTSNHN
jgi:O-antigen/teichoic acid export membrane protein